MSINKDGFLAKLIRKEVERDRKRFKGKEPQPFLNEKKQLWYFMLEQMERADAARAAAESGDSAADSDSANNTDSAASTDNADNVDNADNTEKDGKA